MKGTSTKRLFDLLLSFTGLILLAPLLLGVAVLIKSCDGGAIFFRQMRMGRQGKTFSILKFRTMTPSTESAGPRITATGDIRVTPTGRFLRRTKLDELPQLWNVFCGSMSFVGPRPELQYYLQFYPPELLPVLELTPGITDLASLYFRNEEELLSQTVDHEEIYRRVYLPIKLRMSLTYGRNRSLFDDIKVICRTILHRLDWRTRAEQIAPGVFTQPQTNSPKD